MEIQRPTRFESMTGSGVVAEWKGATWKAGKPAFVTDGGLSGENGRIIGRLEKEGKTVVGIASERGVVGWIALQDRIRPEAKEAVSRLKRMGIRVVMLTGDRRSTGEAIGARVGVDEVHAELLPEDKVRMIKELEMKYGRVAMAGDGVNDAPALATASVGIAMGRAGTDVALDVADVVLMNDDLDRVATTLSLGRRSRTVIAQNLAFASLVIFSLILANFGGHISLPFGVVGHEGSTILVILNGLRLLR
jgi:Cd2+/Zn2+-exporting ATPase